MTEKLFTARTISPQDPLLAEVKNLGRKHRKTLGLFPDGAFSDYAARGTLLIAQSQKEELAGYCAFRCSKGRAMIAHLCVAEAFQGAGIARLLFEEVKRFGRQRELVGVGLHCRRDYPATQMWPKLGFAPRNTKPGRGSDGVDLTFWWYDLNARDLWSDIEESDDRLLVVIDCNVFRDLHDDDGERNQEASFLTADWLSGQIQLCIVDELFVEIDRLPLSSPREQWVREARSYRELKYDDTKSREIAQELKEIFRDSHSTAPQHDSDLRYIAKSAAASANVFLTRDGELLEKAAEIEKRYGLQVKRPVELIAELNEVEQAALYQPVRFASTDLKRRRPKLTDVERLATAFHLPAKQESRSQFVARLRAILSDPKCQTPMMAELNGTPLFVLASSESERGCEVTLLRTLSEPLAATALRHALLEITSERAAKGGGRVEIADPGLSDSVQTILHELGFRLKEHRWQKVSLPFVGPAESFKKTLIQMKEGSSAGSALELEALYWPAKITEGGITTWAVPIQEGWATQLFEKRFAEELLFAPSKELILSRENVYYSAALQSGMTGAGRILWYISKSPDQRGTGSIRACSRLLNVRRGSAKSLFNEFRRLGVFEWRDIVGITKGEPEKEILALHFADTELFAESLDLSLARDFGIYNNFTSPVKVAEKHFAEIYRRGMRLSTPA